MAKTTTTTTTITDDVDGSKDATEIAFSYKGTDYVIDLSKKNAAAFEKALKVYIDAGTKVFKRSASTRRAKAPTSGTARQDLAQVREWAKAQGIEVSDRGRVAASVLEQYDATN